MVSFEFRLEVCTPCLQLRRSSGREQQSHNLFSPVMMITWGMKLGGNLPPGYDALLFSISATGSGGQLTHCLTI